MDTLIISDDLSGAAGMASLLGTAFPTIPFNRINLLKKINAKIISIDLETRNSKDTFPRLNYLKNMYPEAAILARIDTLMRGSTLDFIGFIKQYGKIMLTDTIPEFGRYTFGGSSIQNNKIVNIEKMLPAEIKPFVTIADSCTYSDIEELARKCIIENYIPMDPGILISQTIIYGLNNHKISKPYR